MRFLILFIYAHLSFAGLIVVSDFDDTIKHTNVKDPKDIVINVLLNREAFTGMPELLNEMKVYADKLFILTGSPSFIKKQVVSLLKKNHIQYDRLITNPKIHKVSTYDYKVASLTKLLTEHPNDQFIFLGDDGGKDPEIYDLMMKKYPDQVLAIYTHVIQNRDLPISSIPYISAADISVWEHHFNRLNEIGTLKIFNTINLNKRFSKTIPDFAYCPGNKSPWSLYPATQFEDVFLDYQVMINENCLRSFLVN